MKQTKKWKKIPIVQRRRKRRRRGRRGCRKWTEDKCRNDDRLRAVCTDIGHQRRCDRTAAIHFLPRCIRTADSEESQSKDYWRTGRTADRRNPDDTSRFPSLHRTGPSSILASGNCTADSL